MDIMKSIQQIKDEYAGDGYNKNYPHMLILHNQEVSDHVNTLMRRMAEEVKKEAAEVAWQETLDVIAGKRVRQSILNIEIK